MKAFAPLAALRRILEVPRTFFVWARGWTSALRLFLDPSQLDMVFALDRALSAKRLPDRLARLRADDVARAALDTRRRLTIDVAALSILPEGSLGRTFAEFLRRNELDPNSIPKLAATSDEE